MNKHVPHQSSFDTAKLRSQWQGFFLILSTAFTIISILLNSVDQQKVGFDLKSAIIYANAFSSICAVFYVTFEILVNDKFYNAGNEKRLDLVDHAFDTNLSGDVSRGYFNPGNASKGVYRLAVLTFENSLFTSNVAQRMTLLKWIYTGVITSIFIFSAAIGNKDLVNNILQIAATGILIQQTIRLQQFSNRIKNTHSEMKRLFNDLKSLPDKSSKEAEMIRLVLNYEATLSWGGILLDSKIFKKYNDPLSLKWEKMKQDYQI